jgi:hypothetical protein
LQIKHANNPYTVCTSNKWKKVKLLVLRRAGATQ